MNEQLLKALGVAKRALARGDANLAVYAVRDLPETKEQGLDDLAWALYQDGFATCGEVEDLLQKLSTAYGIPIEQ